MNALREAGAEVAHTFVIFYYDIFGETDAKLREAGIELHYLATWWDVLAECKERNKFSNTTIKKVEEFLDNPHAWSRENGGK